MELTHILLTAVNAVFPIILLIILGYILRQTNFLSEEFIKIGNKLVFKVCLPCMLFINVYEIESFASVSWDIVFYAVAIILVIFILGYVTAVATTNVPERRGVLLQCAFRSNFAIIGLSLAGALGGSQAQAVAAIISAFTIPTINILAVIALSMFKGKGTSWTGKIKGILLNVAKNPLIIAVMLGLACIAIRTIQKEIWGEPVFLLKEDGRFLYTAINNLKSIASALALIILGGQFTFSAVKGLMKEIVVGTVWRISLAPLLGIGFAIVLSKAGILSCGVNEFPALIALFGSPVAVSSAIMAEQMEGDGQLATQLVVWTSLCSVVTVFLLVCALMGMGLLSV